MSVKKNSKKNIVSEALVEIDKMKKDIKEESENTIHALLDETVKNFMKKSINEGEEEDDDDDYSIEDETADDAETEDNEDSGEETEDSDSEIEDSEVSNEDENQESTEDNGDDDEWSEFDKYKVGDDTYDFTGEQDDDKIVKVYKLLKDDDQVVIKQNGDNLSLKDNETGAEYVIDCGSNCGDVNESTDFGNDGIDMQLNDEDDFESQNGDFDSNDDFEFDSDDDFSSEDDFDSDDDFEFDSDDDLSSEDDFEDPENNFDNEDEFMEGKEPVYEIDLGYTDNYQDKDPIRGLNMNEPSKSGKSWHKGVPTGTQKPWAGKGSSKPFGKLEEEDLLSDIPADEVTEGTNVTMPNRRKKSKSHSPQQKENPKVAHHDSKNGEYKALEEKLQRLQRENKELKAAIPQIKKGINEAVLVNYKLGRIVKLFSENTTSKKEKIDIINRFNDKASNIRETKALYESIQRELKSTTSSKAKLTLEDKSMSVKGSKINETTIYKTNETNEALDLIKRMGNL